MDVHVFVDDHHVLDVVMPSEGAEHDVLRLALLALADLNIEVITAGAAARKVHVAHVGKASL